MEASLKSCIRFVHHNLHKPLYRLLTVHVWPNGSDGPTSVATRSRESPLSSVSLLPLWGFAFIYLQ